MLFRQEFALEAIINLAATEIDVKMHNARKKGATRLAGAGIKVKVFKQAPDVMLLEIAGVFQRVILAMDHTHEGSLATAVRLFKLTFGKGTRFYEWLQVQEGEHATALNEYYRIITEATRIQEDKPVLNPVQVVVTAEIQQAHNMCLVFPFLRRMIDSKNFKGNHKDVQAFYNKLEEALGKLIALETESVTTVEAMWAHYKTPEFFQCQHVLSDLVHLLTIIRPSMLRADEESQGEGGFHWHLGEDFASCLNELDQLDRSLAVMQLIKKLPNSIHKMLILNIRQEDLDHLLGQRITRGRIETAMPEGMFSVVDSWSIMARGMIANWDLYVNIMPDSLKANHHYRAGSMEELLVKAAPNQFHWFPSTGQFKDKSCDEVLPISTQRATNSYPKLDLLRILSPDSNTRATPICMVSTYSQLIEDLIDGHFDMNTFPAQSKSGLQQARAMAERLLLLVFDNSLFDIAYVRNRMKHITKRIETTLFERNVATLAEIDKLGDIRAWPVQTVYKNLYNPEVWAAFKENSCQVLKSRVAQAYKEEIAFCAGIEARFNHQRTAADIKAAIKQQLVRSWLFDDVPPTGNKPL